MIVPLALSALLARCAPNVGPITMSAVVAYESGGRPTAIGDNTQRRSYAPPDRPSAVALATRLLALGHNIDVGYAQVNSGNFAAYGLTVARALEPCANVAVGAAILGADYRNAARAFGPGQLALVHALSAYNSGGAWRGLGYARSVYATAARLTFDNRRALAESPVTGRAVAFRPLHGLATSEAHSR